MQLLQEIIMKIHPHTSLVATFDFDPISVGNGEPFRYRLEVMKKLNLNNFEGRVYRLETYRLQPTFPQNDGAPPDIESDALIFVVDETFDLAALKGISVEQVLENFCGALERIFG
jgi:hypothetical protein